MDLVKKLEQIGSINRIINRGREPIKAKNFL